VEIDKENKLESKVRERIKEKDVKLEKNVGYENEGKVELIEDEYGKL
jgi:pyruvate carboxylase